MNRQWTIGIAAVAGLILGKMLLPVLGDYIEKRSINPVNTGTVQQYINNSKLIKIRASSFVYSEAHHEGNMFYRGALLADYWTRTSYAFYDATYQKYFAVQMFNYPDVTAFDDLLEKIAKNVPMECEVNNDELADPNFGTQSNPIPSFKCIIPADTSWADNYKARARIVEKNNAHYETSVRYYLTYYMPKAQYKKMFNGK